MMESHLIALSLAVVLDHLIGDPRSLPHPVIWIGNYIKWLEKRLNVHRFKKWKGILFLILVIFSVFIVSYSIVFVSYRIHTIFGIIIEAVLICYTIAQRSLKEAALEVWEPLENSNLEEGRKKLSYIVGRDTAHLDEGEIVRGAVETIAENTCDGITAPLFYALLGGAPFAFVYRAVNTCDSMVGYKNEKYVVFGWASARLDDVLNFIPSRITGILMILFNKVKANYSKRKCFEILWSDARKHPSPNSGWGEAAVASLLGIQLGGTNCYQGVISYRATMGISQYSLNRQHILQAISIMNRTVYIYVMFLWTIGGMIYVIT